MRLRVLALVAASAAAAAPAAQLPARIEFQRDVQPIFREHCISCHGPDEQMSGLRLDRRADALRGGSQSDIGPGSAQGSRLYHRLIGTTFGPQMPPAGPLDAAQVETIKQWIDEGAEWPDDAAGETPAAPPDPDAIRLMTLIRADERRAIDRLLLDNVRVARSRGTRGSTPLMAAALYGDAALVKRLLAAGADPDARNDAGATALMWAVPDLDNMQLLLDAGADVNARSDDRRSALVVTSGIVGAAPALRLLLDYGADPSILKATDPSPLREAARADDAEIFRVLLEYGASPKGAGSVPPTLLRYDLLQVCGAGRRRWTVASPSSRVRVGRHGSEIRPRESEPADTGWRDAGDACRHPRRRRAQPSAAPGRRRGVREADRLCVLSSQQRRLDGGRCRPRGRVCRE